MQDLGARKGRPFDRLKAADTQAAEGHLSLALTGSMLVPGRIQAGVLRILAVIHLHSQMPILA